MFRVEDKRQGTTYQVFTLDDPSKGGCQGNIEEGVSLDYDLEAVHAWSDGQREPEACLGRAPDNPKHYKVFKYGSDLQAEGYQPLAGSTVVYSQWKDYLKLWHPEDLPDEDWYHELDRFDEAARRRRQRAEEPDRPTDTSRDGVAAWVARTHFFVDAAIREIWYLPQAAPPDEIRLLELNDRLEGSGPAEAIDFGLDIEGAPFRLLVADVTSEQLDQINQDPSLLPPGWSLEEVKVWPRGPQGTAGKVALGGAPHAH